MKKSGEKMTSKEIVQRTLDFANPPRVARSFGDSDLCGAQCNASTHATEWIDEPDGSQTRTDEWGNSWRRIDPSSKGEVICGVLEDLSKLETYTLPDYSRFDDYAPVVAARKKNPDKWLVGDMPGLTFNIARKMRKLDAYLTDLYMHPETIHELHDRIDAMLYDMIRNYAAAGVDSVFFPEDWGTQSQTFISPDMWYEEFYPRFKNLCAAAHKAGVNVFMHSCGKIGDIIPGLIDAGIDVLQFDQPDLHGIDTLARYQQHARITFWSPIDIQHTLHTRNEMIIRKKAREMLDKLWHGRGGFIAGFYQDNESIGLDPIWQKHACDEFVAYGVNSKSAVQT